MSVEQAEQLTQATTVVVATTVGLAVATTVTTSTASAVASTVASSTAGGVGGGAGGGGGASGGDPITLMGQVQIATLSSQVNPWTTRREVCSAPFSHATHPKRR